ncbi:tRNA1(Val) (adenine(37)-N6)-methyltransferase [Rhodobium gokarnense]|uniref:tRNA1(Val) A37 N6-methylase TrmN6 n=1 Tax=Rhodobium gokarnense TaxID=364296 RepID=A0ABT3H7A8_9HYPH|nr:methyltransferase [Rhodobium gokarnense]MCW2306259.1 tRNA1(Val) A37 N6-methylase TrmN6 [Rhodobium gokarnense]
MSAASEASDPVLPEGATRDAFLGGAVTALQPGRGRHRSGLDAVMLAATLSADTDGTVVDLGAGSGVAGFCVAARAPAARVVLVDNDPVASDLARRALALADNMAFAGRVSVVETDIVGPEKVRVAAGLTRAMADTVIMNPPFREEGRVRASPNAARAAAHVLSDEDLDRWMRTAVTLLVPGGGLSVVWPAERLAALLGALSGRFGGIAVLPLHPYADTPALRVLVTARKGSRAPFRLLQGRVLHEADGDFCAWAKAVLRDGAGLDMARG